MNIDLKSAIINPNDVLKQIMIQREKYLEMVPEIRQGAGKDKRYYVYLRNPRTNERKLIRKPTKEEVKEGALEYLMSLDDLCDTSKITVESYWKEWYDFKIAHNVELTSMSKAKFVSDFKTFIKGSEFASMSVQKVKPKHIEDFLCEQIKKNNLSIKRACQLAGYIKGIFKLAYRNDLIKKDIWPKVDLRNVVYPCCRRRTKTKDEIRVLSDVQIYSIVRCVNKHLQKDPTYLPDYGILISLYTGMRAGEIVALQWEDIQGSCLYITHAERRISNGDGTQRYEVGDTKTHKERKIPISDDLRNVLKTLKRLQKENRIDTPFVLCLGKRPNAGMLEKAAKRRGEEIGIESVLTIHRIRRTVASKLNQSFDRATVSHILGHTEDVDWDCYDYDVEREEQIVRTLNHLYA